MLHNASPAGSGCLRAGRGPPGGPALRAGGRLGGGVAAREAAREMPAEGFPSGGVVVCVLVPGVPHDAPFLPTASPGQRRRSRSPALHNVPAGSGQPRRPPRGAEGWVPSAGRASAPKPRGVACCRSLPARPLFSDGAGGCCPRASGINGSGPAPVPAPCGAALASALFVTFVAVFQALRDRSHNSSWKCCIM